MNHSNYWKETQANAQADENKQLTAQLGAAMTALNTANQKVEQLTRQLAQAGQPTPATPATPAIVTHPTPPSIPVVTPPKQVAVAIKPPAAPAAITPIGTVVKIVAEHGFAIINIGTNHGIKKNDTFIVRSKKTGRLVGTLRINNPIPEVASADLGQIPIQNLTPGDTLHPMLP